MSPSEGLSPLVYDRDESPLSVGSYSENYCDAIVGVARSSLTSFFAPRGHSHTDVYVLPRISRDDMKSKRHSRDDTNLYFFVSVMPRYSKAVLTDSNSTMRRSVSFQRGLRRGSKAAIPRCG
jgi:hypothetical protein